MGPLKCQAAKGFLICSAYKAVKQNAFVLIFLVAYIRCYVLCFFLGTQIKMQCFANNYILVKKNSVVIGRI